VIDDTDLPLSEIAFRAGFGSLRRFNAVFAEVYKRPPSEIRRAARTYKASLPSHCVRLTDLLRPAQGSRGSE
jgi:AraC-like DNA-binding protein